MLTPPVTTLESPTETEDEPATPAGRLKKARLSIGLTQEKLGDLLGITKAGVSSYETGRVGMTTDVHTVLSDRGISLDWLLTGEGTMYKDGRTESNGKETPAPPSPSLAVADSKSPTIRIPIAPMGHAAIGPHGGRDNTDAEEEALDTPITFVQRLLGGRKPEPGSIFWSYVVGESMEPWLPDGTPILIERCDEIGDGGRYALWVDDGSGDIIKRCERLGGNMLHLISDNRAFPSRVLEHLKDADETDTYRDVKHGHTLRLTVRGRIISPRDTSVAVMGQLADFARSLIR